MHVCAILLTETNTNPILILRAGIFRIFSEVFENEVFEKLKASQKLHFEAFIWVFEALKSHLDTHILKVNRQTI